MKRFRPTSLVVGSMYQTDNGYYVLYKEHLEIVQKLEERVKELEDIVIDKHNYIRMMERDD